MSRFAAKIIYCLAQFLRNKGFNFHESTHPKVQEMKGRIAKLGAIKFKIEFYPDGSWVAESVNIDGILTGGLNVKEINSSIRDAIFTYFEISPHLCNDRLIKMDNEPATVTQMACV